MGASRIIDFFDGKSHPCVMSEKEKYPSELAERFQIRLPLGLRDRIKAYAERHGRSMNTEIVRILEREFPPAPSIGERAKEILNVLAAFRQNPGDENIEKLAEEIRDTFEGIVTGRIYGVSSEVKGAIQDAYFRFKEEEFETASEDQAGYYDAEEEENFQAVGRTEKFTVPGQEKPDREDE